MQHATSIIPDALKYEQETPCLYDRGLMPKQWTTAPQMEYELEYEVRLGPTGTVQKMFCDGSGGQTPQTRGKEEWAGL